MLVTRAMHWQCSQCSCQLKSQFKKQEKRDAVRLKHSSQYYRRILAFRFELLRTLGMYCGSHVVWQTCTSRYKGTHFSGSRCSLDLSFDFLFYSSITWDTHKGCLDWITVCDSCHLHWHLRTGKRERYPFLLSIHTMWCLFVATWPVWTTRLTGIG